MEDGIEPVEHRVHFGTAVADAGLDEAKIGAAVQMGDVGALSCRKIVEADDLRADVDQALGEVRADEPGAARDEDLPPSELRVSLLHQRGLAVAPDDGQ